MDKAEAIERLEYLKAKAQRVLGQKISEWIAIDIRGTVEAYDMAIEALQTENSSEKPNNCEDLQDWKDEMWAEAIVTEPTISKMEQVDKDINVRSKTEPQTDCTEALTLLWIKNMVTDEEFYRIDARLKVMPQTERSE